LTASLLPALTLAQTDNDDRGAKGFCARLSTISSNIEQRIANRDSKLTTKRAEIAERIEERRSRRDERLVEKRARWDANREAHFVKMEEKAQTSEKKQAVVAFTEAVNAAIATRRAAIDAAIGDFRDGVAVAIALRKSSVDAAITTFRSSVISALEKAESDCGGGVDPGTVRANLRADLKAARAKLVSDRQGIEKIGTQMELLITTKRAAVKKALDDFNAALEQARTDFKAVSP